MPIPNDVPALRRLLGMANYLARFCQRISDICHPLRQLLNKDVEWVWAEDQDAAVKALKEAITTAPVLQYFDKGKTVVIQSDASSTGLGTALLQDGRPEGFASRALTSAERNYAQIEKELLAVLYGLEQFDQYTYGQHVFVQSDHKPLEVIAKKPLRNAPKRLQRMLLRMQWDSLSITYVQGSKMFLADALSRAHPHHTGRPCQFEDVHCTEQTVFEASLESVNAVQEARLSPELLSSLQKATEADPVITTLKITIRKGWPERKADVQSELKVYFDIRDELVIVKS